MGETSSLKFEISLFEGHKSGSNLHHAFKNESMHCWYALVMILKKPTLVT